MTDNAKFIADVAAFADKTAEQMLRVAKQSIQDVVKQAQTPVAQGGSLPIDTGFLRNSLVTTVRGATAGEGENSYVLGISSLQLGDPFQVAWVADYAISRHYMVGGKGSLWRDKAAQRWSGYVENNARLVQ